MKMHTAPRADTNGVNILHRPALFLIQPAENADKLFNVCPHLFGTLPRALRKTEPKPQVSWAEISVYQLTASVSRPLLMIFFHSRRGFFFRHSGTVAAPAHSARDIVINLTGISGFHYLAEIITLRI